MSNEEPSEVSLMTDIDGSPTITDCNRSLLKIAVDNILQKALDAVGEKGEIQLRLLKTICGPVSRCLTPATAYHLKIRTRF